MVSRLVCVFVFAGSLAAQSVPAPSPPLPLTVHAIWSSPDFASDLVDLAWMKDGKAYTTVEPDASGSTDLYRVDALSGARQLVLRGADLTASGARKPIAIEEYRFSGDGTKLLLFTNSARVWRQNTKGTFFVWDFTARRLIPVSTKAGYQQFAKFSPDARRVAFVRDNNIYVTDLASGTETALTTDGGDNVITVNNCGPAAQIFGNGGNDRFTVFSTKPNFFQPANTLGISTDAEKTSVPIRPLARP